MLAIASPAKAGIHTAYPNTNAEGGLSFNKGFIPGHEYNPPHRRGCV